MHPQTRNKNKLLIFLNELTTIRSTNWMPQGPTLLFFFSTIPYKKRSPHKELHVLMAYIYIVYRPFIVAQHQ